MGEIAAAEKEKKLAERKLVKTSVEETKKKLVEQMKKFDQSGLEEIKPTAESVKRKLDKLQRNDISKKDALIEINNIQKEIEERQNKIGDTKALKKKLSQLSAPNDGVAKDFADKGVEVRKTDIVGPKAGAQLRISGFQAMAWALLAIMIYIALRFDFKYSPGAIVALFHDVVIVVGCFALTGREFTLQTVAALLAVIGYSVNDTVVVYDRVREHEVKFSGRSLKEHINNAINETLSRTILTSGTTLFVALSMFFFGGQSIHDFFFAITLGVLVGTYSSIFVAAPVILFFDKFQQKA